MSTTTLSFWLYTLAIIGVGIYSARFGRRSSTDFFLANCGIGALWIIPWTMLAFLFNWLVLANRLQRAAPEQNAITIPDVLAGNLAGRHGYPAARHPHYPHHAERLCGGAVQRRRQNVRRHASCL